MQSHREQIDEDDLPLRPAPPSPSQSSVITKKKKDIRQRWWQRMPKGERKKDQSLLMCESR